MSPVLRSFENERRMSRETMRTVQPTKNDRNEQESIKNVETTGNDNTDRYLNHHVILKAATGRGHKLAVWTILLHDDLIAEFGRLFYYGVKCSAALPRSIKMNLVNEYCWDNRNKCLLFCP